MSKPTPDFDTVRFIADSGFGRPIKRWLRRQLGQFWRRRLQAKQSPWPALSPTATTLVIAPHPDDDALGCGGLIARRAAAGSPVFIAFITDGAASHPDHPEITPAQLAAIRQEEARTAAQRLGVPADRLRFFAAPDGRLPALSPSERQSLVGRLAGLIRTTQPAEIFVTAAADGSSEHAAANAILREALGAIEGARSRVLEYPVWSRWNPRLLSGSFDRARHIYVLTLTPEELALKRRAIRSHASQVEPLAPVASPLLSTEFLGHFDDPYEFFFEL